MREKHRDILLFWIGIFILVAFIAALTSQACEVDSTDAISNIGFDTAEEVIWYYNGDSLVVIRRDRIIGGVAFWFDSAGAFNLADYESDPPLPIIDTTIDTVGFEKITEKVHAPCPVYGDGCLVYGCSTKDSTYWQPILDYHLDTIGYRLTAEEMRRLK